MFYIFIDSSFVGEYSSFVSKKKKFIEVCFRIISSTNSSSSLPKTNNPFQWKKLISLCVYVCFWFNVRVYKFVQFRLLLFLLFCYFGWTKSMSKNQCICVCIVMTIWCNSFYHTHRNQMRIWIDFVWIHMVFIHNSCVQRLFNVEFKMNRNGWKRIWKKQMKIEIELYTIDVHRMFMNSLTIE